jgi:hypothetical protein
MQYEIIVGNIGYVHDGDDLNEALKVFQDYVNQSESGYGRAAWEDVTLLEEGEPVREFYGKDREC